MIAAGRRGGSRLGALYRCGSAGPSSPSALAIVVGTALAAVAIVPFLELLRNSSDLSSRPRSIVYVQPKFFFASLLPSYFNGSRELRDRGRLLRRSSSVDACVDRAVCVPGSSGSSSDCSALFCILCVLGIQPLFGFVGRLPGFDATYLSRLTILYVLCVALLAGWGLDDLVARLPRRAEAPWRL